MNISKTAIALATFATITLSSAAYIATKEVTSAVLVDKAKHSLDLTTNGLHNISVREAFTIDQSEAAQINFLRCSLARPEFRFSWFCHQQKIDGKMTKNSYVALNDDQQKYFKENAFKSIAYVAIKLYEHAEQSSALAKIHRAHKKVNENAKASGVNSGVKVVESVEQGGRELSKAGTETVIRKNLSDAQAFAVSPLTEIDRVSIQELLERFGDTEIPSEIKDFDPILFRAIANEQSKDYVVDFSSISKNLGLVPADTDSTTHAGLGQKKHKVNDRIFVCCMLTVLLTMLIIIFVSLYKDAENFCKGIKEVFSKKDKGGKK